MLIKRERESQNQLKNQKNKIILRILTNQFFILKNNLGGMTDSYLFKFDVLAFFDLEDLNSNLMLKNLNKSLGN
jgi:hypothetical protein